MRVATRSTFTAVPTRFLAVSDKKTKVRTIRQIWLTTYETHLADPADSKEQNERIISESQSLWNVITN